MKRLATLTCAVLLSACASGEPLGQRPPPASFIATTVGICPLLCMDASATQITPTLAATAAHAAPTWKGPRIIPHADVAVYENDGRAPVIRDPRSGEHVTLYGNSAGGGLRVAEGNVVAAYGYIDHDGRRDWGILIGADIGPWGGFSGGGVYGDDGDLLGIVTDMMTITTGQYDKPAAFAYWASWVRRETETKEMGR